MHERVRRGHGIRRGLGIIAAAAALALGSALMGAGPVRAATAASGQYVPPGHNLYYGNKGAAVRSVQQRLAQLHYYPGPVDGVYGPATQQAVWAFKEVQGLPLNRWSNSVITYAFRQALVHPRAPRVLIRHGPAKRVEINLGIQVLVLYRYYKPALILHVSSGGNCLAGQGCGWITPVGNFRALYFYPGWVHVPLGEMYDPVFFIGTAYAIHGDIPVPWYPVSHGCVRIWPSTAAWFHRQLFISTNGHGTPIYIRGTAPYNPLAN